MHRKFRFFGRKMTSNSVFRLPEAAATKHLGRLEARWRQISVISQIDKMSAYGRIFMQSVRFVNVDKRPETRRSG